eukprot:TRINITY_DN16758_c0_g1_i1.p1 TRINITY_DN16758_c0_g1~~TRINITY_DN16758_c0_g1_i1.p1  ORF type:complete len:1540 (-),score=253.91 TRINITY_DN16758_c0_g1_i1:359-4978(-)
MGSSGKAAMRRKPPKGSSPSSCARKMPAAATKAGPLVTLVLGAWPMRAHGHGAGSQACHGYDEQWGDCPSLPSCSNCQPVNCQFSAWGVWFDAGGCTGVKFRHREVDVSNNECGKPCSGPKTQTARSMKKECVVPPVDCKLSEWEDWSGCVLDMPNAFRARRTLQEPKNGGRPCDGLLKETRTCHIKKEVHDCLLSEWHEWTACSASCGVGQHSRIRRIKQHANLEGAPCKDSVQEVQDCKLKDCESKDCVLGDWRTWTACGGGETQKYRERAPVVQRLGDGKACAGQLKETLPCPVEKPKDCIMGAWGAWNACDLDCGGGQQYRSRKIDQEPQAGGVPCTATNLQETRPCNEQLCSAPPADCLFGRWSRWSNCSTDCGVGSMTRSRTIATYAKVGGRGCGTGSQDAALLEVASCSVDTGCHDVDCVWGDWYEWSSCSCSCGGGTKRRSRVVVQPPRQRGKLCDPEDKSQIGVCNTQSCETGCVDARWDEWSEWSVCSMTCDVGYQLRRRDIAVEATSCGKAVSGDREEYRTCEVQPCQPDQDCLLGDWNEWSSCSCSCLGTRDRNRVIKEFARGNGKPCANETAMRMVEACNPGYQEPLSAACGNEHPQDCQMSSWTDWSDCSRECGGGQRSRARNVVQYPQHGGQVCEGFDAEETEACNTARCQKEVCIDCVLGAWSKWSDCSHCGDQRYRFRHVEQLPNHCGRPCANNSESLVIKETSNCTSPCIKELFCAWSDWSTGSGCSGGCGGSTMKSRSLGFTRKKPVNDTSILFKVRSKAPEDSLCSGQELSVATCDRSKCIKKCVPKDTSCSPVDCVLEDWSFWSACTGSNDQRTRHRSILEFPLNGGKPCEGALNETKPCGEAKKLDCRLSDWASWTACTKTCTGGTKMRQRVIAEHARAGGAPCSGSVEELVPCGSLCDSTKPIDCAYTDWTAWSICDNHRQKMRERVVATEAKDGGQPCSGSLKETETCPLEKVDCKVSEWTTWDACDRTCGGGQQARHRHISGFAKNGGAACPNSLVQNRPCKTQPCIVKECELGDWSDWSGCSTSCGAGQSRRERAIVSDASMVGAACNAGLSEIVPCETNALHSAACGVQDCVWNEWGDWSACTRPCAGGQRVRQRHVKVAPSPGGNPCTPEDKEDLEPCNTQSCGTERHEDGAWNEWTDWSPCSATCMSGTTFRHRKVLKMAVGTGKMPEGPDHDTKFCNEDVSCEKDVDCKFGDWTPWSACTAECNGIHRRSRQIAAFGRGHGAFCVGPLKETFPCNPGPDQAVPPQCITKVKEDFKLSPWTAWGYCTATCGGGQRTRKRAVLNDARFGGHTEESDLEEVQQCGMAMCPGPDAIDCQLGDWDDWSACTKCGRTRKRFRHIVQYPMYGGKNCNRSSTQDAGPCPLTCEKDHFCTWESWMDWGPCTARCGKGNRMRIRKLSFSEKAAPEPLERDAYEGEGHKALHSKKTKKGELVKEYQLLATKAANLTSHSPRSTMLAFGAGFLTFAVLLVGFRVFTRLRPASAQDVVTSRAMHLHEALQNESEVELASGIE